MNVLFTNYNNVQALFYKLIIGGSINESLARAVLEMSATFTWNGRGHLLRKGDKSDWSFFIRDLERAWEREVDRFVDNNCEVDILVHT